MQVDVGNNKILDNYRPIVTSPHLKALHGSSEAEKAPANVHISASRTSSSSSSSASSDGKAAHRHRTHHTHHRRGSHLHSHSPSSGNKSKSRRGEGIASVPDSTPHRTPASARRNQHTSCVTSTPLRAADHSTPLNLPPVPCLPPNPHCAPNSLVPAGTQRSLPTRDHTTGAMNGERSGGGADAQKRASAVKKLDGAPHRGSSQNVDGGSDDAANGRAAAADHNNKNDRPGADDGAAKPAKPKLAQTNVQPGMQLKHWVVVSRIGAGSFGETFAAVEVDWAAPPPSDDGFLVISPEAAALLDSLPPVEERSEVCIKVEQENKNVLRLEALALKKVQPCTQVVRYLGSGCTCGMNFLVMEKLGNNLAELRRRSPHGTFNIYTTLRAGVSCLQAIREVHAQGLIHRDIKPSNFVTGLAGGSTWAVCYLIDFGLARRFMRSSGEIRPPRDSAGFRGTSRYASVASHLHLELGRVDDLWSLLFMLVEFATGTLPWRKYKDKEDIGRCKEESIGPHLVRNLPREFQPFLAHLQTLRYEDEPDYDYLLSLMEKAIERRGYPPGKPVDWELDPTTMEAVAAQEEQASRQPQPVRANEAEAAPSGSPGNAVKPHAVAVPASSHNDYAQQPVSKRERGGSRASSSPAVDDALSPSRAGNPSRVSVSEVELGYERRPDGRGRESYREEPAASLGQQQVQGSDGKAYSSSDADDDVDVEMKRGPSGTDFSPREANSAHTRKTDSRLLPAPSSTDNHNRPMDVDEAYVSPDSAGANDGTPSPAAMRQPNQGAAAQANNTAAPATGAEPPAKKKKQKSKCNCAVM